MGKDLEVEQTLSYIKCGMIKFAVHSVLWDIVSLPMMEEVI